MKRGILTGGRGGGGVSSGRPALHQVSFEDAVNSDEELSSFNELFLLNLGFALGTFFSSQFEKS